jgi:EAL domain-containing protein (putative c-di-GMP-specific phosphodiesterase class I)
VLVRGFAATAGEVLDDLRARVGVGTWAVGRRNGADYVVLATTAGAPLEVGTSVPWHQTLAARVLDGAAPSTAGDVRQVPTLTGTLDRLGCRVGAYLSVPVVDPEGRPIAVLEGWDSRTGPELPAARPLAIRYGRLLGTLLSQEQRILAETRRAERAEAVAGAALDDGRRRVVRSRADAAAPTTAASSPVPASVGPAAPPATDADRIDALLAVARERLGMDQTFLARFEGPDWVVRSAAGGRGTPMSRGMRVPIGETYCNRMVSGTLERVVPDARRHPVVGALAVTRDMDIESWMGVPVYHRDGRLYGTLCALSHPPAPGEEARRELDLSLLEVLAVVLADLVEEQDRAGGPAREVLARLDAVRDAGGPTVVFQPVVALGDGQVVGYEALSRFPPGTPSPERWFADAQSAGLGAELELSAVTNALRRLDDVRGRLGVNVSPEVVCSGRFARVLEGLPLDRLVVELTEHQVVEDYERLLSALRPLREAGLWVAVDDVGAGFSSLLHVLRMEPDVLKLDVGIVRQVDADPRRRTLAQSLGRFAEEHGVLVVAEGIETEAELTSLREIGITHGQGYLLGRPAELHPRPCAHRVSTRRGA